MRTVRYGQLPGFHVYKQRPFLVSNNRVLGKVDNIASRSLSVLKQKERSKENHRENNTLRKNLVQLAINNGRL